MSKDKAKEISKDYADQHTCYANDPKLQYLYTRKAVEFGYHQAEKDLELTREDIETILNIENDILHECNSRNQLIIATYPAGKDYYQEILKRFKERKE